MITRRGLIVDMKGVTMLQAYDFMVFNRDVVVSLILFRRCAGILELYLLYKGSVTPEFFKVSTRNSWVPVMKDYMFTLKGTFSASFNAGNILSLEEAFLLRTPVSPVRANMGDKYSPRMLSYTTANTPWSINLSPGELRNVLTNSKEIKL